jgi:hypothetical protein
MFSLTRRVAFGFLFVIVAMFGLGSFASASADPSVTVEPVTATSPGDGQVTFTDGGNPATVIYGSAEGNLANTISLVPNQVVTVSLNDADMIYWQATSDWGTSTVHAQDTDNWGGFLIFLLAICCFAGVFCFLMAALD